MQGTYLTVTPARLVNYCPFRVEDVANVHGGRLRTALGLGGLGFTLHRVSMSVHSLGWLVDRRL